MTDQQLKEIIAQSFARADKLDAQIEKIGEEMLELKNAQIKTDAQLAKTDAQLAKTDAQLAKTDAQLAKTDAQLAKTDAQLEKTDAQLAKTMRKLDDVGVMLGNMGILQGNITEEMIYRALDTLFGEEGKKFYSIFQNLKPSKEIRKKYGWSEYDIVAVNGSEILVTEVKSQLKKDDIDKFVNVQLPRFTQFFPQYENYSLLGAVGGALVTAEVENYAIENGLYVIVQNGENLSIANEKGFEARIFSDPLLG